MSDVDDEELAALRAAALASLNKAKSPTNCSVDPPGSRNVAPISTVMASTSYSSYNAGDQSNYSSQYSWRNQSQNNRRGRGSRPPFPKVNQRSNLIVITPIASEEKNSDSKGSTSQLVLPQHKWCQSINEDSSSPRSFKKTGPTRFNRHGSDSESSDSEPELSDNDSYSNETILQDEPSDHYATRSGRSLSPESSPEKSVSERRLSFQNMDSGLDAFPNMESTSVYKCLKNSHNTSDKRLELPSVENDTERSWKRGSDRKYPYTQSDNVSDNKHSSHEDDSSKSLTLNGEPSRKHKLSSVLSSETEHSSRPQTENFREGSLSPKSNRSGLSKNDLRLELKKRMQEMQQNLQARGDKARSSSRSPPSRRPAARSRSRSTNGHRSRSPSRSRSRRRSHSLERRHGRKIDHHQRKGHSPSPVCDRIKLEQTHSPRRNSKRNRSSSSDHSRKERSRSPRRTHRRGHSSSSDRSQKERSRSPLRSRKRVDSPVSDGSRKKRSRSPRHKHRRDRSSSSDRSGKDQSRSPAKKHRRGHSLSSDDRQDNGPGSPSNQRSPVYSRRNSHRDRVGRRRNRSTSSSESSDSSRHSGSAKSLRSVSSVVKPVSVVSKVDPKERTVSSGSDSQYPREKIKLDRVKPLVSSMKSSVENKNSVSDGQKRVPVHMRLGSLPGKRVIQMTKDVEAAFVNTSSDEGGDESNGRHKKDNSHVMFKANDSKNDESSKRHAHRNVVHSDTFKEGRFKHRR